MVSEASVYDWMVLLLLSLWKGRIFMEESYSYYGNQDAENLKEKRVGT
jgi:hypothetical protein